MSNPGQNHWFFSCLTVCFGWTIRPFHGSDVLTSLSLRSEWNLKILAEPASRKPAVFSIIGFAKCICRNFRDRAQAPATSFAPSALVSAWMKIERSRLFCYSVIKFLCYFHFLLRKLLYFIIIVFACQELFSFLNLFFSQATRLLYHTFLICQYFFKFFFHFSFETLFSQAQQTIYYHLNITSSTLF